MGYDENGDAGVDGCFDPECDCCYPREPSRWYHKLASLALLLLTWAIIVGVLCLATGCTQQERQAFGTVHTRRVLREQVSADGGKLVVEETWTETTDTSKTTSGFDPAITDGFKAAAGAGMAAARGDYAGAAAIIAGAIATAIAGWAGNRSGKATVAQQRAEEHKADAAEGWAKYEEAMKTPPRST